MRCHYDILNVSLDASQDDLKKSYRALALKWHPDKNPDNIEVAHEEFRAIQQAYTVLSDPRERSFYDAHREDILKGVGSDYVDESINIFPYFNNCCFSGYDDDENGFYSVYRKLFKKLAEESLLMEENVQVPEFGDSKTSFEIVQKFYGYWSVFCTKKSYAWKDIFDTRSGENRRIVRLMEQENKRMRNQAKKDRNNEVRTLVAFVRKRDKRVAAQAEWLKQKSQENVRKTEENRRKMIDKHKQNIASYKANDWDDFSVFEKQLKEIESNTAAEFNDYSDASSVSLDDLYCVACDKSFKTDKSFANHEKSKKHRDNVVNLKSYMGEEDQLFQQPKENDLESNEKEDSVTSEPEEVLAQTEDIIANEVAVVKEEEKLHISDNEMHNKDTIENEDANITVNPNDDSDDISAFLNVKNKKKQKKLKKSMKNINKNQLKNNLNGVGGEDGQYANSSKQKHVSIDKMCQNLVDLSNCDTTHNCVVCKKCFSSRTKLFSHLQTSGHAIPLPVETNGKSKKAKDSKKKRNNNVDYSSEEEIPVSKSKKFGKRKQQNQRN